MISNEEENKWKTHAIMLRIPEIHYKNLLKIKEKTGQTTMNSVCIDLIRIGISEKSLFKENNFNEVKEGRENVGTANYIENKASHASSNDIAKLEFKILLLEESIKLDSMKWDYQFSNALISMVDKKISKLKNLMISYICIIAVIVSFINFIR